MKGFWKLKKKSNFHVSLYESVFRGIFFHVHVHVPPVIGNGGSQKVISYRSLDNFKVYIVSGKKKQCLEVLNFCKKGLRYLKYQLY